MRRVVIGDKSQQSRMGLGLRIRFIEEIGEADGRVSGATLLEN